MPPSRHKLPGRQCTDLCGLNEAPHKDIEENTVSLWYLLALPPIRRRILDYVSAFDAAKLDSLQLCVLTGPERSMYLKPLRDLVWNVPEVQRLSQEGMKLTLLGDCAYALEQRLHATQRYLELHGNGRLKVYLLGTFPIFAPTTSTLDRLVGFSTTGLSSPMRSFTDKYQLRRICATTNADVERTFVMSFSAPMRVSAKSAKGLWYRVDDVPDHTVDLWVYVPSFSDRLLEEVRFTPLDILRISRANSMLRPHPRHIMGRISVAASSEKNVDSKVADNLRRWFDKISTLSQLFAMCTRHHRLRKWSLTIAGVQSCKVTLLAQLLGNEISASRLLPHLGVSTLGANPWPRAAVELTQAPRVRLYAEVLLSTIGVVVRCDNI
jgi:hypothetical protein